MSREEVGIIASSMNEALELEDWEFPTRVGAEKAAVRAMQMRLRALARTVS
jgi:hypothetical protein